MKRIFVAIRIKFDTDFLYAVDNLREELADEHIKWVEEENMHLTLRFLGETEETKIPAIIRSLRNNLLVCDQFKLLFSGLGFFSSGGSVKAFFIRLKPSFDLEYLKKLVDDSLFELGYEGEKREFKPHLTLGRVKYLKNVNAFKKLIEEYSSLEQTILVREIILYESKLYPTGPVYIPIERFSLR